eukprot:765494-Hanusia_phi.AAC.7
MAERVSYPPTFVIGGFKMADGAAVLEGLKLPPELPAGTYHLRIGSVYQNCFQEVEVWRCRGLDQHSPHNR